MKLSIIIPVYNVEKYVEQCLSSCENQDIPSDEYELVVINDGTKDKSLSIIEEFAKSFSNIRIVSQINQGLSTARNNGLKLAQGDYVWFVDSDDWIEDNCLGSILKELYSNNLDAMAIVAANVFDDCIVRRTEFGNLDNNYYSGYDFALQFGYLVCAPFTIYKRKYLLQNNLFFMENVFHEDSEFTPRAYYNIPKMGVYNKTLYYVRQNPNSITRSINPKKSFDLLKVAQSLYEFSKNTDKQYSNLIHRNVVTVLNTALLGAQHFSNEQKNMLKREFKNNKYLFKCFFSNFSLKFYIEGLLFSLFPQFSLSLYNFFNQTVFHRKTRW